ncbi:MAG: protease SohB [Gammaproteobacteria bacterium]|nr:MAG: protease SohB [Gammaproteobacteria bacterium]
MEFLTEYGLFLAKAVTIVVSVLLIVSAVAALAVKEKKRESGHIEVNDLNKKLKDIKTAIQSTTLEKDELKALAKKEKQKAKEKKKHKGDTQSEVKKNVYVIEFDGDIKASQTSALRETITGVLAVATKNDEVVVKVESGGGMVHSYGLASAQLDRIKKKGIPLTVCVDKVAASGGYMMACVADKIIASPFAVLGSIGVVAQVPNVHRLLKKNDIDFDVITAGEYKRTMTVFGENTEKGRQKFIQDLEDTHVLFKQFVSEHRPVVAIDQVANGDIWYGQRALDVQLVDDLMTSDEYLAGQCDSGQVYQLKFHEKKTIQEKLGLAVSAGIERAVTRLITAAQKANYFS